MNEEKRGTLKMILDRIESPEALRELPEEDLPHVAEEIRFEILKTILRNGGHLASSLGVVELTLALHYCFDFRKDRLIFDVGHQCYPHKILTGRRARFPTIRTLGGLSGFPYPPESPYDLFHTGHAGTSISLGVGMACRDRIAGEEREVVVVIGDASLGSGVALEALNWAGQRDANMLIVLNDNEMSISRTVGALARYLNRIRMGPLYTGVKKELQNLVSRLPIIGEKMDKGIGDLVKTLRNTLVPGQLFEEFGCKYYGPINGHDLPLLLQSFRKLKNIKGMRLLHILTEKGKGYEYAVEDPESFHGVSPGTGVLEGGNGKLRFKLEKKNGTRHLTYTAVLGREIVRIGEEDERVVAITAAMPDGTGLKPFGKKFPERYFDTGISEQHAAALAGGLAAAGAKPVLAVYSTFAQRCYDQIFQEICLQHGDVLLAMDRGGVVGQDGPTHHGLFDIAYLRTLPGITLASPRDAAEFAAMIRFGIEHPGPVGLRYPRAAALEADLPLAPIEQGRGELLVEGEDVTILAYGPLVLECLEALQRLAPRRIYPTLINARFAKPLDEALIGRHTAGRRLVVTVEEHALAGGFGSAVAECLGARGFAGRLVRVGVEDRFVPHATRKELLDMLGLTAEGIAGRIVEAFDATNKAGTDHRRRTPARDQEVL